MNMADNSALLKRDTKLPGLEFVLSPNRIRDLLCSRSAIQPEQQVELDYIRYKPGRRALSLMHIVSPQGSRQPIVVNASDAAAWEKVSAFSTSDSPCLHTWVWEDKRCAINWFPFDRRLPQAAKLFDDSKTLKVLSRVVGIQPCDPLALETLAYKPNRRLVVKASSGKETFVLKCYAAKDFANSLDRVQKVAHAAIDACTPIVVGASDRYSMIAFAWIDGEVISPIAEFGSESKFRFYQAGALLSDWHTCSQRRLKKIENRHPGFHRNSLAQLVDDIQWLLPELECPLRNLLEKIDCHLDAFTSSCDVIHGDFYAKQILVQNNQLRLIDFDEVSLGHRYQDLGTFIGNLVWNATRTSTRISALENAIEEFVRGYEHQQGPLERPLFQAGVAAGILRCLPHAFRRGEPNWPFKIHQMLEHASNWCPQTLSTASSRTTFGCKRYESSPYHSPVPTEYSENQECSHYLSTMELNQQWRSGVFRSSEWSDAQVESTKLVRHKPGRRLLVEYTLRLKSGATLQTIGKARFRKAIDERLVKLHNDLQCHHFEKLRVPQILGTLPQLQMWLQEKALGEHIAPTSRPTMHRDVGKALAELHLSNMFIDRFHTVSDELLNLKKQIYGLLSWQTKFAEESQWLILTCNRVAGFLLPAETTIIHRDFYHDQAIGSQHGIYFLDFDLAAMGQPELDAGNYLAHLDEYGLRKPQARNACNEAAMSFVEGYSICRPSVNLSNVNIWRFLSLARLAAISQRIPERWGSTDDLISACREWFATSQWRCVAIE